MKTLILVLLLILLLMCAGLIGLVSSYLPVNPNIQDLISIIGGCLAGLTIGRIAIKSSQ